MHDPVVMSQSPLVPSVFLHFFFGFCLILDGLQTPRALHLALVTQALAEFASLAPQTLPPRKNLHL